MRTLSPANSVLNVKSIEGGRIHVCEQDGKNNISTGTSKTTDYRSVGGKILLKHKYLLKNWNNYNHFAILQNITFSHQKLLFAAKFNELMSADVQSWKILKNLKENNLVP